MADQAIVIGKKNLIDALTKAFESGCFGTLEACEDVVLSIAKELMENQKVKKNTNANENVYKETFMKAYYGESEAVGPPTLDSGPIPMSEFSPPNPVKTTYKVVGKAMSTNDYYIPKIKKAYPEL